MQRSRNGNERFQVTSKLFYVVSRVMHKQETIGNNGWEAPESVNTSFCNNRGWDAAITDLCGDRNWFWVLAFVRGYTSCPFFFLFFYGLLILAEVCMSEYFCCEKWRFPVEAIKSVSKVVQFSKDRERMVLINVTHICVWSVCICVCVSACARLCVH